MKTRATVVTATVDNGRSLQPNIPYLGKINRISSNLERIDEVGPNEVCKPSAYKKPHTLWMDETPKVSIIIDPKNGANGVFIDFNYFGYHKMKSLGEAVEAAFAKAEANPTDVALQAEAARLSDIFNNCEEMSSPKIVNGQIVGSYDEKYAVDTRTNCRVVSEHGLNRANEERTAWNKVLVSATGLAAHGQTITVDEETDYIGKELGFTVMMNKGKLVIDKVFTVAEYNRLTSGKTTTAPVVANSAIADDAEGQV